MTYTFDQMKRNMTDRLEKELHSLQKAMTAAEAELSTMKDLALPDRISRFENICFTRGYQACRFTGEHMSDDDSVWFFAHWGDKEIRIGSDCFKAFQNMGVPASTEPLREFSK